MISLQPRQIYTVVRQLPNPSDSTTYYVRAVVRNSIDDTILTTLSLTDKGDRRFKVDYEAPADVSGMGFYIDITTIVYTDSGYTTKSTTYSEELEQYLVFDRITKTGGSGGGADVDYKKIQKMIDSAIKVLTPAEVKKEDYSPILSAIQGIKTDIAGIEIPEPKDIEFTPVMEAIKSSETKVIKAIDDKTIEIPPVDFEPVLEAIDLKEPNMSSIEDKVNYISKYVEEVKGVAEIKKLADMLKPFFVENKAIDETEKEDILASKVKKML